jgi:hypothetical protein
MVLEPRFRAFSRTRNSSLPFFSLDLHLLTNFVDSIVLSPPYIHTALRLDRFLLQILDSFGWELLICVSKQIGPPSRVWHRQPPLALRLRLCLQLPPALHLRPPPVLLRQPTILLRSPPVLVRPPPVVSGTPLLVSTVRSGAMLIQSVQPFWLTCPVKKQKKRRNHIFVVERFLLLLTDDFFRSSRFALGPSFGSWCLSSNSVYVGLLLVVDLRGLFTRL